MIYQYVGARLNSTMHPGFWWLPQYVVSWSSSSQDLKYHGAVGARSVMKPGSDFGRSEVLRNSWGRDSLVGAARTGQSCVPVSVDLDPATGRPDVEQVVMSAVTGPVRGHS